MRNREKDETKIWIRFKKNKGDDEAEYWQQYGEIYEAVYEKDEHYDW